MEKIMSTNRLSWQTIVITMLFPFAFLLSYSHAHEWMAPKEASNITNPVTNGNDSKKRGQLLFEENCMDCHGENGQGRNASELGLNKDAPNLPSRLVTHTDGDFFWKIQHGRGEMPGFKKELEAENVWDIINFLKD